MASPSKMNYLSNMRLRSLPAVLLHTRVTNGLLRISPTSSTLYTRRQVAIELMARFLPHTDVANLHDSMTQLMTLRLLGHGYADKPWETLEQPSNAFRFGHLPGTITLNEWASMSSVLPPAIALRDAGVMPRTMSLENIFERLQELRHGIEDDDESLLYRILYKRILRDPDKFLNPHRTLDKQITDLILVLSRPDWIDFSNPRNQVATRFIFERGPENQEQFHKFFHQLLLSLELELRIQSEQHSDWAKEKLTSQIPPSIQWNLALARRWQDFVRVDDVGKTPEEILLRYKLKKRQIRMLRRFAQMMRWPNLTDTLDNMKQKDSELALDEVSSDAFAFFSGLVLPGQTFPFLMMNTLLDLDPDSETDNLALLSHMHPHCGFQYKNSYTYWSASSIVGKVLAPTCHAVGGWIGPARSTADLEPTQIARIRSRKPKQRMTPRMSSRWQSVLIRLVPLLRLTQWTIINQLPREVALKVLLIQYG
ncbi:hypothetical protein NXS19_001777 [Fusarium pseudograminearum]|nr:hypothetical protein NXS19_001777 [Fusarium pseudograminearum]